MSIVALLTLLQDYEMVVYYLAALIALRYIYLFIAAQVRLSKTAFGLERELCLGQRNKAAGTLALIIGLAVGVNLAVRYGLPEAQRAELIRVNANAEFLPTITPSPTPLVLFGVDVSGCDERINPRARLLEPRPGDAVRGKVTLRIVADISNFAFYKIELGTPDEPDLWIPIYSNNESAPEEDPFTWVWDSTTVVPGVYHLRLTVLKADLTFPAPCVVPIQVLSAQP
ncbi:MAG: hypothetical protein JW748_02875 [Anaerolineales bacterium]|nr:hypothetical protein [Anaerolineales bacterium]